MPDFQKLVDDFLFSLSSDEQPTELSAAQANMRYFVGIKPRVLGKLLQTINNDVDIQLLGHCIIGNDASSREYRLVLSCTMPYTVEQNTFLVLDVDLEEPEPKSAWKKVLDEEADDPFYHNFLQILYEEYIDQHRSPEIFPDDVGFGPGHGDFKPATSMKLPCDRKNAQGFKVYAGFNTCGLTELSQQKRMDHLEAVWRTILDIGALPPAMAAIEALEQMWNASPSLGECVERDIALEMARIRKQASYLAAMASDASREREQFHARSTALELNRLSTSISRGALSIQTSGQNETDEELFEGCAELLNVAHTAQANWQPGTLALDDNIMQEFFLHMRAMLRIGNQLWQSYAYVRNTRGQGQLWPEPHEDVPNGSAVLARKFMAMGLFVKASQTKVDRKDNPEIFDPTWSRSRLDFRYQYPRGTAAWLKRDLFRDASRDSDSPLAFIKRDLETLQNIFEAKDDTQIGTVIREALLEDDPAISFVKNLPSQLEALWQPEKFSKVFGASSNLQRPTCDYSELEGDQLSRTVFVVRDVFISYLRLARLYVLWKRVCLLWHLAEAGVPVPSDWKSLWTGKVGKRWNFVEPNQGPYQSVIEDLDGPFLASFEPATSGYLKNPILVFSGAGSERAISYALYHDHIYNVVGGLTSTAINFDSRRI